MRLGIMQKILLTAKVKNYLVVMHRPSDKWLIIFDSCLEWQTGCDKKTTV